MVQAIKGTTAIVDSVFSTFKFESSVHIKLQSVFPTFQVRVVSFLNVQVKSSVDVKSCSRSMMASRKRACEEIDNLDEAKSATNLTEHGAMTAIYPVKKGRCQNR